MLNLRDPSGSRHSHSREGQNVVAISARKTPVQARSRATVEAILDAASRVLLERRGAFTTTRVAERAGVGIGTLYQYYPSKEALLVALLDRKMGAVAQAMADAIATTEHAALTARIEAIIDAILAQKRRQPELASILRAELGRIDGHRRVVQTMRRNEAGLRALLESHADELAGLDLDLTAGVLTSAVEGTLNAAIERAPTSVRRPEFRDALVRLVLGYLRESGWQPS